MVRPLDEHVDGKRIETHGHATSEEVIKVLEAGMLLRGWQVMSWGDFK